MGIKILVVDDEPDFELLIRQKFRKEIKDETYSFAFASNGVEALSAIEADKDIDIVLTDIRMPKMDGLVLLGEMNALDRPLKAIVVSAYGDMKNIRAAMNEGAFDFVTKPIDFNDLEKTFQKTAALCEMVKKARIAKKELGEINAELRIARKIQDSIIPNQFNLFPNNQAIDINGLIKPAKDVGGDFFDIITIDETHFGVLIADVSGKSISAALFMAIARTLIHSISMYTSSPLTIIRLANQILTENNKSFMFVTVFLCTIDIQTGMVCFCNAGHHHPLVLHENETIEEVNTFSGMPLGIVGEDPNSDETKFQENCFQLQSGDALVLYTDGVLEAFNENDEMFGFKGLKESLKKCANKSAANITGQIMHDVESHIGTFTQWDDISLVAIRYQPEKS
ncbi:MAG: SpoIIE family protein phosphatase [Waddliaceae bacterium]